MDSKPFGKLIEEFCKIKKYEYVKSSHRHFDSSYTIVGPKGKSAVLYINCESYNNLDIEFFCNHREYSMKLSTEDRGDFILDCFGFITKHIDEC